ncbi:MAG: CvpA family protein [Candidatus Omnitrophica bacterium]|nr:CvpA family protein [Candidatus Omnitrophota bacterium]
MLYPYVSQFNWIDILIIICTLRTCYIGLRKGLGIELFKVINLFFCSFVTLHFYFALGEFIQSKIPALPLEPAAIFSYILLIFIITMLFRILREGFFVIVKTETISNISKYSGLFLGFIRGVIISAFIIFGLLISTIHYLELSARTSFFGSRVVKLQLKIYEGLFYGSVAKIFPDQSFNQEVIKVLEKGNLTN